MFPIRAFLHFLGLFLFVSLSGCASKASLLGEPTPLARPGFGYVAATMVARVDSPDSKYILHDVAAVVARFAPVGPGGGSQFEMHTGANSSGNGIWFDPKSTLPMTNGYHAMQLIPVPVGSYRLNTLLARLNVYKKFVFLDKFDTPPFAVREGEVTYVGSVDLTTTVGKNLLGMTVPARLHIHLADHFEPDWAAMQKADERLKSMKVSNGLATASPK